ncbi:MAG: hypothetical protein Q8R02_11680 [Hyphomonadaceae bacterium]|nr:hypothetical protein [Hyphomonadaceae bacterium]
MVAVLNLALPKLDHVPAQRLKRRSVFRVTFDITRKLRRPKSFARLGIARIAAPLVPMPETTVHEYDGSPSRENDIRRSGQIADMQPEAIAQRMQRRSHLAFRASIPATNSLHDAARIGESKPRDAGWYVICNGRVVREADRRAETGWGYIEDEANRIVIPVFHNQFARFRGVVTFDSQDSSRVPWNTTKTDVDQDSHVLSNAFERMLEMMRPVISFLNELDRDIDEYTRDKSPLYELVKKTTQVRSEALPKAATFKAPKRTEVVRSARYTKVQYSKKVDDIEILKDALNLTSASAVGERTFDIVLARHKSK